MVGDAGNAPAVVFRHVLRRRSYRPVAGSPPEKMARRRGAAPRTPGFGDRAALAGARRVKGCSGPGFPPDHRPEGDAPKFARTLCASAGDGGFGRSSPVAAPHRPAPRLDRRTFFRRRRGHHCMNWKLKGPDRVRRPGPCHFNKEQTPSQVVIAAATGISRWTFRCLGHTSSEALKM